MKIKTFLHRMSSFVLALLLAVGCVPLSVSAGEQPRVWMFDPGHGGTDPGAIGCDGVRQEKDDNLALALAVAARMRAAGETVLMTRDTDQSVELNARSDMANEVGVTYFISFHRNSATNIANGVETYYHTDLDATSESAKLAAAVQKALVAPGFKDRGVKQANFSVLRRTEMPAILLETGFMNNPAENSRFDDKFDMLADGIAAALLSHVGKTLVEEEKPTEELPVKEPVTEGEDDMPPWVPIAIGAGVGVLVLAGGVCAVAVRRKRKRS